MSKRQGGLSSPYFFNLFYQERVDSLSKCTGSIQVSENSYNVFCYADDLVVTSLSVTGLQNQINSAKSLVVSHGLNLEFLYRFRFKRYSRFFSKSNHLIYTINSLDKLPFLL